MSVNATNFATISILKRIRTTVVRQTDLCFPRHKPICVLDEDQQMIKKDLRQLHYQYEEDTF